MTGKIYKIVNDLNDKVYVGQTIRPLAVRFQKHCSVSDDLGQTMAIKRAILKYGREHFKIELIEECETSLLNERERYWIDFYNAYTKGYNCTRGGQDSGHSQKLTPDEENELIALYELGVTSTVLAKMYNVDMSTVLNYLKRNNVKRRNTLEGKVDIEAVKLFIRDNKPSAADVAQKFGISKCSVYNIIKEAKDDSLILKSHTPRKSNAAIHSQELCDKYKEGYNIQDLIKMFHSSKRYISKVLKENGVEIQRGRKARL